MIRASRHFIILTGFTTGLILTLSVETAHAPQQPAPSVVRAATSTSELAAELTPPVPESNHEIEAPEAIAPEAPEPNNTASHNGIRRIQDPYPTAPLSAEMLDKAAREAIVNIHCISTGQQVGSISGSGVMIDPRGVILTNAHVAQYLLLDAHPDVALSCTVRTGSPARSRWKADILYLPEVWIRAHASDIEIEHAQGSGEHDFALLLVTNSTDGTTLPDNFPFLPPDVRNAITFTSDHVLLAGYPAEFGGSTPYGDMYISSVFTKIGDLYTFTEANVDLISLGGIVLAQSGSSGGAVVNTWGHLVGLISTTSQGETTAERNLRAISVSYIDRTLATITGSSLNTLLAGDLASRANEFMSKDAPLLAELLIAELK